MIINIGKYGPQTNIIEGMLETLKGIDLAQAKEFANLPSLYNLPWYVVYDLLEKEEWYPQVATLSASINSSLEPFIKLYKGNYQKFPARYYTTLITNLYLIFLAIAVTHKVNDKSEDGISTKLYTRMVTPWFDIMGPMELS